MPNPDNVIPGQTTFVDSSKDDTVNQKLELITKNPIKDLNGLKKAVQEYKYLNNQIKKEIKDLTATVEDVERPIMERVGEMKNKSEELLKNILEYSKDNSSDFKAIPNAGKHLNLGDWDIVITEKTSVTIKPITPANTEAGVESETNHGS